MTGLTSTILAVQLALCGACADEPVKPAAGPAKPAAAEEWTVEKHLKVGGQPSAAELPKLGDEAYRFIFTDAGITSSKIVTVYRKGNDYYLKAAEVHLHDYYGSNGTKGVEKIERRLTADEWNCLQAKLKKLDFWNFVPPVEPIALDGTNWTLEGAAGGKHLTTTMCAPEAGPFRSAGLYLWRTSGTFMGYWADKRE